MQRSQPLLAHRLLRLRWRRGGLPLASDAAHVRLHRARAAVHPRQQSLRQPLARALRAASSGNDAKAVQPRHASGPPPSLAVLIAQIGGRVRADCCVAAPGPGCRRRRLREPCVSVPRPRPRPPGVAWRGCGAMGCVPSAVRMLHPHPRSASVLRARGVRQPTRATLRRGQPPATPRFPPAVAWLPAHRGTARPTPLTRVVLSPAAHAAGPRRTRSTTSKPSRSWSRCRPRRRRRRTRRTWRTGWRRGRRRRWARRTGRCTTPARSSSRWRRACLACRRIARRRRKARRRRELACAGMLHAL